MKGLCHPVSTLGFPIFLRGLDYIIYEWHFDLRGFLPPSRNGPTPIA
nr:MAG TPA: hypothetical protein [Caudoviricetes sp.]